MNFETFKYDYIFSKTDPYFSKGLRKSIRYASISSVLSVRLMEINPEGLVPIDYLNYAKADLLSKGLNANINAVSNANRAIHLLVDSFLEILGLNTYKKSNFPDKLEIIEKIEAFPVRLINALNKQRNSMEHKYTKISKKNAVEFVELTDLFLRVCYPYLKKLIVGIHVGLKRNNKDIEWVLYPSKSKITISEYNKSEHVKLKEGIIYFHYKYDNNRNILETIEITKTNSNKWIPILNTLLYCTAKSHTLNTTPYDPNNYSRLMLTTSEVHYYLNNNMK